MTARAAESQYARIVQLVRSAQASKSPLQRLADRYAIWFTPVTLAVCLATFAVTRDPARVLAVLVVATPCPLILATPVAVIGGINRAARARIIVRTGAALEQLSTVTAAVFDKTGTLTIGKPEVNRLVPADGFTERDVLALAAAVEQRSGHLLARSVVEAARNAELRLADAEHVIETPGRGVVGEVRGHEVAVGSRSFALERCPAARDRWGLTDGAGLRAYVLVDGIAAGVIEFDDKLRRDVRALVENLGRYGVRRTVLLSGDDIANTRAVADALGIREARGDLLPQDKVAAVAALMESGERVLMTGDGTNDAPALSTATVGIALAGHGGGIAAEAADVVILVDDVTRVAEAIRISRRTMRIARQSIWTGLAMSGIAMLFAALGAIPPTVGAILQEVIDVAVIVNALRASR